MFEGIDLFASLTVEDKKNLEFFCQERDIRRGNELFREGEEASAMYILTKGKFEVYKTDGGHIIHLGEVQAEEILGEMAIFGNNFKRMATARALEDSHIITLLSFSIKELTEKYPELFQKILDIIDERNMQNKQKS